MRMKYFKKLIGERLYLLPLNLEKMEQNIGMQEN